jgi:serine/threonine protein kinase
MNSPAIPIAWRASREAQSLAALNIAAIYGLEESDGRQALVLELVDGVTLAQRIAEGPLPDAQSVSDSATVTPRR